MAVCFLLELLIPLYMAPPLLRLIAAKIAMEKAAGVGLEFGRHDPGPLAKCPHNIKIHKAFRKVHVSDVNGLHIGASTISGQQTERPLTPAIL